MQHLPRRPLAGLAIAFITGTGLGLTASIPPLPLLLYSGISLTLAVASTLQTRWQGIFFTTLTHVCLLATVLGLGWANAAPDPDARNHAIPALITLPTGASLTGIITDEPVCVSRKNEKATWKFPMAVEQVRAGWSNEWQQAGGTVRFRLFATASDRIPSYGERWSFRGYLAQVTYKQGLFAGKPGALFFSGKANKGRFSGYEEGNPLVAKCLKGRAWAAKLLERGITDCPQQLIILNSILLGYYSQIPRDLYQAFANTGTLHVFAISGSHVVIFAGAVIFILAAAGLSRMWWILFLGPLLVLYIAMTGLQPSAIRAGIMGVIYWSAPLIGRKSDIFTTLAASAILILGFDPGDLLNIGFILSYVAVLGLVLFCPVFMAPLHRCFQHDPLKLEPDPPWQENLRAVWLMFADMFSVSLAAWLVTAPLTVLFFGNFSLIGLPANLLVVPLSSLVIITGVLSLTLGSCFLFLADLFNHANLALIILMTESTRWFAAIPHGYLKVDVPPLWMILAFYAGLLIARFAVWVYSKEMSAIPIEGQE
ncbi:MAG: ComEC/Rec2 family competence protein [bacterium]